MKTLLLIALLLLAAPAFAKDKNLAPAFSSATAAGSTAPGAHIVIFLFSSDFAGTVGGVAFAGTADTKLELRATEGDSFAAIPWTRSAGTIRVIQF